MREKPEKGVFCVGADAPDVISLLGSRGEDVLAVERDPLLPAPLRSHADLQVLQAGGTVYVNERQERLVRELEERGFSVEAVDGVGDAYPADCRLNGFLLGDRIVGNGKCLFPGLTERYGLLKVKQGYAKCSSIVVGTDTVFTDDPSIFRRLSAEEGIDCRFFPQKEIFLEGYDRGFLGGCCGFVSDDEILFIGDPGRLSCGEALIKALEDKGIRVIHLGEGVPYDFGGIVHLTK